VDELGGFQDAVAKAWQLAGQSGEPRMQMPPRDMAVSLRDLMRGAFQGAAAGVGEGVRGRRKGRRAAVPRAAARGVDVDQLWAPWRMELVSKGETPSGCIFCELPCESDDRKT